MPGPRGDVMRLQVKGKNVEVSDSIRRYAEEKMRKLDRQLHALTQVELELRVEKNPSISANQVAEATVWTKGPTIRACFFFSSRRRHTSFSRDWSSDVCSSDLSSAASMLCSTRRRVGSLGQPN